MEMGGELLVEVMDMLSQIGEDSTVPKNVRFKVKNALVVLNTEGRSLPVKINASIQELDECSDDPNIPPYVKQQIWDVVSRLESI